jgi:hypothetical protein
VLRGNPKQRVSDLKPGRRGKLSLAASFYRENGDAGLVESVAHLLLEEKRGAGEWFDVTPEEAADAIRLAIERVEAGDVAPRKRWPGSTNQVGIRMDAETKAALEAAARADDRTVSALILRIIKEWLSVLI